MKNQFIKWSPVMALASFTAAVFMISGGYYWPGVAMVCASSGISSAAAISKKRNNDSGSDQESE